MTGGYKQWKGQLQTYPGSATGEPVVTTLIEANDAGMPAYIGEAKYGTRPIENKWFIAAYRYDVFGNIIGALTAVNQCITGATSVTVDVSTYPGSARIQLVGADLSLVSPGDGFYLKTASNFIGGTAITQILSPTEVLVPVQAVNETATPIVDQTSITFVFIDEQLKSFDKRRWDKKHLYIYQ